jgi:integrase
MRRKELLGLTSDSVDLAGKRLRISSETGKGKKERIIPFNDQVLEILRAKPPPRPATTRTCFLPQFLRKKAP